MFRVPPQDLHFEPGFNERDYESPECKAQIESFAKAYQAAEFVPPLVVRIDAATGLKYVVEGHQRTLLKDIATLDQLYALNEAYFKELTMYVVAGKEKLEQVRSGELAQLQAKAAAITM